MQEDLQLRIQKKKSEFNPFDLYFFLEKKSYVEISLIDEKGLLVYNYADYFGRGEFLHSIILDQELKGHFYLRVAKNGQSQIKEVDYK